MRCGRLPTPFELAPGDYTLTFKKRGPCQGEYTDAELINTDPDAYDGGSFEQNDYIYGIEGGRYYFDVDAWEGKCQWTLSLKPLE